jgi:hypothetical protein
MEIFNITPGFVYTEDVEFKTIFNEAESGLEKTRDDWGSGTINGVTEYRAKRTFGLVYNSIPQTTYALLLQFFKARGGKKEAFYWENFNESPITRLYPSKIIIASNYQSEDTTQLAHYPIIADSQTIYDDGALLVEGVNYSFNDSTGLITWIIKPAAASIITGDYRFYRGVHFKEDKITFSRKAFQVFDLDVLVREIAPRL